MKSIAPSPTREAECQCHQLPRPPSARAVHDMSQQRRASAILTHLPSLPRKPDSPTSTSQYAPCAGPPDSLHAGKRRGQYVVAILTLCPKP
jgi:hypothetical protein